MDSHRGAAHTRAAVPPRLALSSSHLPSAPGRDRLFNGGNVGRHIIAVATGCIPGHDLLDRGQVPLLDIEMRDERVPMVEPILPTLHLGVSSLVLIDTGAIWKAALIA